MSAVSDMPPAVLFAMAAQEFAGKLERIDSLTVSPDMLAGIINQAKALMPAEQKGS